MRELRLIALVALLVLCGCGGAPETQLDSSTGTISQDLQLPARALAPIPARTDWEFDNYYVGEQLLLLGQTGGEKRALLVKLRHVLSDNRFKRAERDFAGYYFDGTNWRVLPYTRARHDSTSLLVQNDYYFGSLQWSDSSHAGTFFYDRDNVTLGLEFGNLVPVQSFRTGEERLRGHAIGSGILRTATDTVAGTVYYRIEELADYNPLTEAGGGIEMINNDWLALIGDGDLQLLASSDSATAGNRLLKNFVAIQHQGKLLYADGSDNYRLNSDLIKRDAKVGDHLALRKEAAVPALDFSMSLDLTEDRFFYTSGYALAIVVGEVELSGEAQQVWGIVDHQQLPKANPELLK
jgi:hypothetical protein